MVLLVAILLTIVSSLVTLHFVTRLRYLQAMSANHSANLHPGRFRPMLRLLSPADERLVSGNKELAKKFRDQRIAIFREYLRCLTSDYGRLLAGVRAVMASASQDRPELAVALSRNERLFAMAICRIEYRLWMHRLGIGTVDVSALVNAIDALRIEVSSVSPALSSSH